MNPLDANQVQTQAAEWAARLQSRDCSELERAACRRWRAAHPAHEAAFQRAEETWRQCRSLGDDPALAEELHRLERQAEAARRPARWRRYAPPMLALAAALGVLSLLAPRLRQAAEPPGVHYATAIGEQRTVALPDGSSVVLDTGTALVVRYSQGARQVALEAGQASFTVARDAARPFRVQAAGGSVTALGTQFLVRLGPAADAATVTLLEGKVRVEGPQAGAQRQAPATLAPGQQLRFDQAGQWATLQVNPEAASAWTRGSVYADDWRLADLLVEMNRYAATPLRLTDPALAELRVTGVFRTGDLRSLQRVLEHDLPVRAVQGEGGEILLVRRTAAR